MVEREQNLSSLGAGGRTGGPFKLKGRVGQNVKIDLMIPDTSLKAQTIQSCFHPYCKPYLVYMKDLKAFILKTISFTKVERKRRKDRLRETTVKDTSLQERKGRPRPRHPGGPFQTPPFPHCPQKAGGQDTGSSGRLLRCQLQAKRPGDRSRILSLSSDTPHTPFTETPHAQCGAQSTGSRGTPHEEICTTNHNFFSRNLEPFCERHLALFRGSSIIKKTLFKN